MVALKYDPSVLSVSSRQEGDRRAGQGTRGRAKRPPRPNQPQKSEKPKKVSAHDAARVLSEAKEPMNCQDPIKAMADKGYWTSPGGKTPWATDLPTRSILCLQEQEETPEFACPVQCQLSKSY
jgi:hypothetical protein